MALKPDRLITDGSTDISFFMNELASKGQVVVLSTAGSGAAMDDSAALATLPTVGYGSGEVPLGILLCDVVSGDLTRTHLNQHKDEVQVGSKVTIARHGWLVTDKVEGTPTAGQAAYISSVGTDGKICGKAANYSSSVITLLASTATGTETISYPMTALTRLGTWLSTKDTDGYAKLEVNLI